MSRGRGPVSGGGGNVREENYHYMYSVSLQIVIPNRQHAEIGEYSCLRWFVYKSGNCVASCTSCLSWYVSPLISPSQCDQTTHVWRCISFEETFFIQNWLSILITGWKCSITNISINIWAKIVFIVCKMCNSWSYWGDIININDILLLESKNACLVWKIRVFRNVKELHYGLSCLKLW